MVDVSPVACGDENPRLVDGGTGGGVMRSSVTMGVPPLIFTAPAPTADDDLAAVFDGSTSPTQYGDMDSKTESKMEEGKGLPTGLARPITSASVGKGVPGEDAASGSLSSPRVLALIKSPLNSPRAGADATVDAVSPRRPPGMKKMPSRRGPLLTAIAPSLEAGVTSPVSMPELGSPLRSPVAVEGEAGPPHPGPSGQLPPLPTLPPAPSLPTTHGVLGSSGGTEGGSGGPTVPPLGKTPRMPALPTPDLEASAGSSSGGSGNSATTSPRDPRDGADPAAGNAPLLTLQQARTALAAIIQMSSTTRGVQDMAHVRSAVEAAKASVEEAEASAGTADGPSFNTLSSPLASVRQSARVAVAMQTMSNKVAHAAATVKSAVAGSVGGRGAARPSMVHSNAGDGEEKMGEEGNARRLERANSTYLAILSRLKAVDPTTLPKPIVSEVQRCVRKVVESMQTATKYIGATDTDGSPTAKTTASSFLKALEGEVAQLDKAVGSAEARALSLAQQHQLQQAQTGAPTASGSNSSNSGGSSGGGSNSSSGGSGTAVPPLVKHQHHVEGAGVGALKGDSLPHTHSSSVSVSSGTCSDTEGNPGPMSHAPSHAPSSGLQGADMGADMGGGSDMGGEERAGHRGSHGGGGLESLPPSQPGALSPAYPGTAATGSYAYQVPTMSPRGSMVGGSMVGGGMDGMSMGGYALVDAMGNPVGYSAGPYPPTAYPGYPAMYQQGYPAYPGPGYMPGGYMAMGAGGGYMPTAPMGTSRSMARFGRHGGGDGGSVGYAASVAYSTAGGSPRARAHHMKHAASVRALQASPEPVSFASREVAEAPRRHRGQRTQRGDLW